MPAHWKDVVRLVKRNDELVKAHTATPTGEQRASLVVDFAERVPKQWPRSIPSVLSAHIARTVEVVATMVSRNRFLLGPAC